MVVLGHETHSPVITLAVVYNAGARHESDADVGLTHCLRMAVTQVLLVNKLFYDIMSFFNVYHCLSVYRPVYFIKVCKYQLLLIS